jgi:hypothetical protein
MTNATDQKVVRRGRVTWLTHPPAGVAHVAVGSHAFGSIAVSLPEAEPPPHEAAPGELLAITHAMFLAAVLSEALAVDGSPADELVTEAACTFSGPVTDRELSAVDLYARGRVPGIDATAFADAVAVARGRSMRAAGAREDVGGRLEAVLIPSG